MWNGLLLRLAESAPITYTELKALSVDEFFKLLITHTEHRKEDKQNRHGK